MAKIKVLTTEITISKLNGEVMTSRQVAYFNTIKQQKVTESFDIPSNFVTLSHIVEQAREPHLLKIARASVNIRLSMHSCMESLIVFMPFAKGLEL